MAHTYRVVKQFRFEAAHRLYRYEGKCNQIHGHSYLAEVCIVSGILDPQNMVIDFGVIKKKIGDWIDIEWDHRILLNSEDPLRDIFKGQGMSTCLFAGVNPTAEIMARCLYVTASEELNEIPAVVKWVRIWETENSYAEYGE